MNEPLIILAIATPAVLFLGWRAWRLNALQQAIAMHLGIADRGSRLGFITGESEYKGYRLSLHGRPRSSWSFFTGKLKVSQLEVSIAGPGMAEALGRFRPHMTQWPEIESADSISGGIKIKFKSLWFGEGLCRPVARDWRVVHLIDKLIATAQDTQGAQNN